MRFQKALTSKVQQQIIRRWLMHTCVCHSLETRCLLLGARYARHLVAAILVNSALGSAAWPHTSARQSNVATSSQKLIERVTVAEWWECIAKRVRREARCTEPCDRSRSPGFVWPRWAPLITCDTVAPRPLFLARRKGPVKRIE